MGRWRKTKETARGWGITPWILGALLPACASMPIDAMGVWTEPVPENITVRDAARVERPWYERGVTSFTVSLLFGARSGLEWNEGRGIRVSEGIRAIPYVGLLILPYWCYESLTEQTMQEVANDSGVDDRRQRKYEAVIRKLIRDGRIREARDLQAHDPFDPAHHPPIPGAKMPPEELDGAWNTAKLLWVELLIGHRINLERNESRGLRKLEYWHPLYVTRIYEAFEAGFGKRMEDVAEEEHLDEVWLPSASAAADATKGREPAS